MKYLQNINDQTVWAFGGDESENLSHERYLATGTCQQVKVVPLDAVVIEGPLPEVTLDHRAGTASFDYGNEGHSVQIPGDLTWEELIAAGLAVKASLGQPPVDEAQKVRDAVQAIARLGDEVQQDIAAKLAEMTAEIKAALGIEGGDQR